ncbi:MAG: DUF4290 domain-containing protein [Balneolales bacterium]|nr:DUF4290 domain-containing protein [Balneolales bacterium]
MFIDSKKPKDLDCGYNLELMIEALPRIKDLNDRKDYAKRIVGLIKQSHINWVNEKGESKMAWEYFFNMAEYDPNDYGIYSPYETDEPDDAL